MNNNDPVRIEIYDALSKHLDPILAQYNFKRNKKSIDYIRVCTDCKQILSFNNSLRPKYAPGACCHLYPYIQASFPMVNQMAEEMGNPRPTWTLPPKYTFSHPMEFTIPLEKRVQWYPKNIGEIGDCVKSIATEVQTWVIPFFEEYKSIRSFTNGYEKRDKRLLCDRNKFAYVVAAYLVQREPVKALEVLETIFGQARPRREMAKVFEYVTNKIKESKSRVAHPRESGVGERSEQEAS